jgi:hypothetical protein
VALLLFEYCHYLISKHVPPEGALRRGMDGVS